MRTNFQFIFENIYYDYNFKLFGDKGENQKGSKYNI